MSQTEHPISKKYPTIKITTAYALFGGAIGGVILGLIVLFIGFMDTMISVETSSPNIISVLDVLEYLRICLICGAVLGFIPALLTGLQIAKRGITKQTPTYLWQVFMIGAAITFILLSSTILVLALPALLNPAPQKAINTPVFLSMVSTSLVIAGMGGVTSALLARLVLPKAINKGLSL